MQGVRTAAARVHAAAGRKSTWNAETEPNSSTENMFGKARPSDLDGKIPRPRTRSLAPGTGTRQGVFVCNLCRPCVVDAEARWVQSSPDCYSFCWVVRLCAVVRRPTRGGETVVPGCKDGGGLRPWTHTDGVSARSCGARPHDSCACKRYARACVRLYNVRAACHRTLGFVPLLPTCGRCRSLCHARATEYPFLFFRAPVHRCTGSPRSYATSIDSTPVVGR